MTCRSKLPALLLCACIGACDTGAVDPGTLDGAQPKDIAGQDAPQDAGSSATEGGSGLPDKPGEPCLNGQCADGLICMANQCRNICSTECGDEAPECTADEGCHWVTSFSAACLPGVATYPETCGEGKLCVSRHLCVAFSDGKKQCMPLCKYGCPSGTACGKTNNGCEICLPKH